METKTRPTTRIEAFTDAAFAFALTMLVISFDELPRSVDDLVRAMKSIPAFLLSGALLMTFWHSHSRWSQRYCLCDRETVWLTSLLVFTVMVYVYPLRLMMSGFMHWISGGRLTASFTITSGDDLIVLFAIYGAGFTAMCSIIALLFQHALRKADELNLNEIDRFEARANVQSYLILGSSGLLSLLICWLLPSRWAVMAAPFAYMPLSVVMPWFGIYNKKQMEKLMARQIDAS